MKRDFAALTSRTWDLLVVGGGVHGAFTAREGALRGLDVALIEQGDFVSATSSQSQKIVHSGLRYLQHGDLVRLRRSIRERSALIKIAPHMMRIMPVVVPAYGRRRKGILSLAVRLHDLAGFDRNRGLPEAGRIPRGRILAPDQCRELFPEADPRGLSGGVVWYDGQVSNTERFVISLLHDLSRRGGVPINHAAVTALAREGDRITGAVVRDQLVGKEFHVKSSLVVNAAGPWVGDICRRSGLNAPPPPLLSRAFVLLVKRLLVRGSAVGIPARTSFFDPDEIFQRQERYFFITPWRGFTLIGSAHLPSGGDPGETSVSREEIRNFLADVNAACPAWSVREADILSVYRGLLPTVSVDAGRGRIQVEKKQHIWDHRRHDGVEGVISLVGVKYTTARDAAARTVSLAGRRLGKGLRPAPGSTVPIYGGGGGTVDEIVSRAAGGGSVPEAAVLRRLAAAYGSAWEDVFRHDSLEAGSAPRVHPSSPVLEAEIVHAVREEMALKLADIVMRRTEIGSAGHPGLAVLEACAAIAARELGWDAQRTKKEISEAEEAFSF